jgi:hypothetical protein
MLITMATTKYRMDEVGLKLEIKNGRQELISAHVE